jgi:uncharacterized protein (TIGR02996 family)
MDTRSVLLAALHDDPADLTTWAALADCLEEEGHPSAALFRDQLALQRANRAEVPAIQRRVREYLTAGVVPLVPALPVRLGRKVWLDAALIPPGTFWMGNDKRTGDADEKPRHRVTLTRPFYIGMYPVTQGQWWAVMRTRPARFRHSSSPVEQVSLDDCVAFCEQSSELAGRVVRLPTEAEWEYACRAGTTTMFTGITRAEDMDRLGWCDGDETHPVGEKQPNGWGLYDMHGNVWEWCRDSYAPYSGGHQIDPIHDGDEGLRVARGGSYSNPVRVCASATRIGFNPGGRNDFIGCRVVVEWSPDRGVTSH